MPDDMQYDVIIVSLLQQMTKSVLGKSAAVRYDAVMGKSQSQLGFKSRFNPFWRFGLRCEDSI